MREAGGPASTRGDPSHVEKKNMNDDHDVGGRDHALADVPLTVHQRQQRIAELLATAIGRKLNEATPPSEIDAHPDGLDGGLELSVPSSLDREVRGEIGSTRTREVPHETREAA